MAEEKLARAGAVSLVGASFAAAAAMAITILVGRAMGVEATGVFYQAIAFFSITAAVLKLGTHSGVVWSIARQRAMGITGISTRITLIAILPVTAVAILVSCGVYFGADVLSRWLATELGQQQFAVMLRQMAPFLVAAAILGVLHSAARMMRGVTSFVVLQDIAVPAGRLLCVAVAIHLALDATGVFVAWMILLPFWVLVTAAWLARPVRDDLRLRRSREDAEEGEVGFAHFWRFTGPRALGVAIEFGLDWADVLVVAAFLGPADAGVYAVASRAVQAGRVVDRAVRVAVAPSISHLLALGKRAQASELHTRVTRGAILVSWPFYLTLLVMGPAVMAVFGADFGDGTIVLSILSVVLMIVAAAGMLQSLMLMGGKSAWQVYNKGAALALSVGGNLIMVPALGILGAALTWAIVVVFDNSLAAYLVHRRLGVALEPQRLLLAAGVAVSVWGGAGLVIRYLLGTPVWALAVYLPVLGAIYCCILWLLRARLDIEPLWEILRSRKAR